MRISIVASNGKSLLNFRGNLIKDWVKLGHNVDCVSIESGDIMANPISSLGAMYTQIAGSRTKTNFFEDLKMIRRYILYFNRIKPDACFLYMSKPVAYGGIAARISGISNINILVSGLEIAFYKKTFVNRIIKIILIVLFKIACKKAKNVFFQNPDDQQVFLKYGIVKFEQCVLVGGSGVDMNYFKKQPLPQNKIVVLMIGRLLRSKGIFEYVRAAKILKKRYPNVSFKVLGGFDKNDDALKKSDMAKLIQMNVIDYLGVSEDVRPIIKESSIFVLPSEHEGTPRSVLEAMAIGRPIVTTNVPGCKETVIDGYNGYLVDFGDYITLANRIETLIAQPALCKEMANHSYEYCVMKYDVIKVNQQIINRMFM